MCIIRARVSQNIQVSRIDISSGENTYCWKWSICLRLLISPCRLRETSRETSADIFRTDSQKYLSLSGAVFAESKEKCQLDSDLHAHTDQRYNAAM